VLKQALGRARARLKRRKRSRRPVDEAWNAAIPGEVGFWDRYLQGHGLQWAPDYEARLDPNSPLQSEIADALTFTAGVPARILDVGAGPLTWLGKQAGDGDVEIVAVDVLADDYNRLLDDAGIVPLVKTRRCETEQLTEVFSPGEFDLVFARNTLDHSYDPIACVRAMLHCARPGGVVMLMHRRNEAEEEDYLGLHQWNLQNEAGDVLVWRPGQRTSLLKELGASLWIEKTWTDADGWEWVRARKAGARDVGSRSS
jgi:SAM-dependent methyltransferase